jgi:tRNA A37 threonylcarbamoyladenosine modification protein TsaB
MTRIFKLIVEKEKSHLMLIEDGTELVVREWEEGRDMGRRLFESIDGILREKGLEPTDISDFILETDVSDNFTSVKIAETVAETYRFATKK